MEEEVQLNVSAGNSAFPMVNKLYHVSAQTLKSSQRLDRLSFYVTFLIVTASACWLLISRISKRSRNEGGQVEGAPLVPGDLGWPIIGDSLWFLKMQKNCELREFYAQKIAKYGSVFKFSCLGETVVLVDSPAGTKYVMQNEFKLVAMSYPEQFNRLLGPDSIMVAHEEKHRKLRNLLKDFFSPHALARSVRKMEWLVVQHLMDEWEGQEGKELSAYKKLTNLTFTLIVALVMSLTEKEDIKKFRRMFDVWAGGIFQLPINLPGFRFHRALKARCDIHKFLDERIALRQQELEDGRATPTQDVLSVMLTTPDEDGNMCSDNNIRDNIMILVYGGLDTTASTMSLLLRHIAEHPQVYDELMKEHANILERKNDSLTMKDLLSMNYTWRVVLETMRLACVVDLGYRVALQDFEYNGFKILKGWKVVWSKSREVFENYDEYNPSRFENSLPPYSSTPFGGGLRICPGNEFARLEILLFLHHFINKFKWAIVDPNERQVADPLPGHTKGNLITITARC